MNVDDIFARLPTALNSSAAAGVDATIQFNNSKQRFAVIRNGEMTVSDGETTPYTVAITMSDDDLVDMLTGKLDGMTAFMTGKLKLDGDLMFAQKITTLFDGARLRG